MKTLVPDMSFLLTSLVLTLIVATSLTAQVPHDTVFVTVVEKTEAHPYYGMGFELGLAVNGVEGATIHLVRDSFYVFNVREVQRNAEIVSMNFYTIPIGGANNYYNQIIEQQFLHEGIWHVRPPKGTPDTLYYGSPNKPYVGGVVIIHDSVAPASVDNKRITTLLASRAVPNPFSSQTQLRFSLAVPSRVRLEVFDVLGRTVLTESVGIIEEGEQSLTVNGQELVGGIYHYRIIASTNGEDHVMTGTFQVLR